MTVLTRVVPRTSISHGGHWAWSYMALPRSLEMTNSCRARPPAARCSSRFPVRRALSGHYRTMPYAIAALSTPGRFSFDHAGSSCLCEPRQCPELLMRVQPMTGVRVVPLVASAPHRTDPALIAFSFLYMCFSVEARHIRMQAPCDQGCRIYAAQCLVSYCRK